MKDLIVAGGTILDPKNGVEAPGDVWVKDGRIRAVGRGIHAARSRSPESFDFIDASGCWVVPGLIDLHVHLRQPGQDADETISSGTAAAARGGFTSVLTMPNTDPVIDSPRLIRDLRRRALAEGHVRVLIAAAVTRGQKGESLTDFEALAAAGAAAFSDDGRPVMNAGLMRGALSTAARLGLPVLDHAEDLGLTGNGVVHEGCASRRFGLPGIPSESESLMAMRDAALSRLTGGHLHICHVSSAETVAVVERAKKSGVKITAEASPHHFSLIDEDVNPKNASFKMKPPLRSRLDRSAILDGLKSGVIDAIATDHAPHRDALKRRGFLKAPFGMTGLETALPLSLELVRRRILTPRSLVERLSAAPARILKLKDQGHLGRGAAADLTVIDPRAEEIFSRTASKSRNSPFLGRRMRGLARATVVGGKIAFRRDPL